MQNIKSILTSTFFWMGVFLIVFGGWYLIMMYSDLGYQVGFHPNSDQKLGLTLVSTVQILTGIFMIRFEWRVITGKIP